MKKIFLTNFWYWLLVNLAIGLGMTKLIALIRPYPSDAFLGAMILSATTTLIFGIGIWENISKLFKTIRESRKPDELFSLLVKHHNDGFTRQLIFNRIVAENFRERLTTYLLEGNAHRKLRDHSARLRPEFQQMLELVRKHLTRRIDSLLTEVQKEGTALSRSRAFASVVTNEVFATLYLFETPGEYPWYPIYEGERREVHEIAVRFKEVLENTLPKEEREQWIDAAHMALTNPEQYSKNWERESLSESKTPWYKEKRMHRVWSDAPQGAIRRAMEACKRVLAQANIPEKADMVA